MIKHKFQPLSLALGLALVAGPVALSAQPGYDDVAGYFNFRGVIGNGGMVADNATGPYVGGFSTVDMASAYAASSFSIFCIDFIGGARDSYVQLLKFDDAVAYGPLADKFDVPAGTAGGLTVDKLNAAAWLTYQFDATGSNWADVHHALWATFWSIGLAPYPGGTPLPSMDAGAQAYFDGAAAAVAGGYDASEYFRVFATMTDDGPNATFDPSKQIIIAKVVPEPGTYALLAIGLVGLGFASRRRRTSVC